MKVHIVGNLRLASSLLMLFTFKQTKTTKLNVIIVIEMNGNETLNLSNKRDRYAINVLGVTFKFNVSVTNNNFEFPF